MLVLRHEDEDRGHLLDSWLTERDLPYHSLPHRSVDVHRGELTALPLPGPEDLAQTLTVVLGGEASVFQEERYPYLVPEKRLLAAICRAALAGSGAVLGICLGGQLLAELLGGTVHRAERAEFGFHEIELTEAGRTDPFLAHWPARSRPLSWHQDVFTPPQGTVCLARSAQTDCQAFSLGQRILGLQFHPEVTREHLDRALAEGSPAWTGPMVVSPAEVLAEARAVEQELHRPFHALLDRLLDRATR